MRFGGTVAGGDFSGGRLGIQLITPFVGPTEFYPAVYFVSSAFSSEQTLENSGWMAQIAVRAMVFDQQVPLYVGIGLVLVKPAAIYRVQYEHLDIDPGHTIFAGLKSDIGPMRPFFEMHVIDFFAFSSVNAQVFLGIGVQF